MSRFRLSRRSVLRGAGSVAIALPWLEIMSDSNPARAASLPAKRFISVFTPAGTVLENWRPTGNENSFTLSPILQPLDPVREHLLIIDGVDMKSAIGEQNQAGIIAWLTGTLQTLAHANFAAGPSIDQVLVPRLSFNQKFPSIQMAVRWGTGKSFGAVHPTNIANFADTASYEPIKPWLDPQEIWQDLFGTIEPANPDQAAWDRSILDAVIHRYSKLAQRVGAEDRRRLEQHLDRLRELELRVNDMSRCAAPPLIDTSDYDPAAGLNSPSSTEVTDPITDAAIPKVGKLMIDMLVMALACDLTSVASLQWSDTEAKHSLPWLGQFEHIHFYMNDGGYPRTSSPPSTPGTRASTLISSNNWRRSKSRLAHFWTKRSCSSAPRSSTRRPTLRPTCRSCSPGAAAACAPAAG